MAQKWYKTSNEYVGPDATLTDGSHIQMHTIDRIQGKWGGDALQGQQSPYGQDSPYSDLNRSKMTFKSKGVPEVCPVCKSKIEDFEIMHGLHNKEDETVYKCKNCGHTNDRWQIEVSRKNKGKKPSRLRRKRRSSSIKKQVIAQNFPPVNTGPNNNPANQPFGRQDFSEDVRVIPWDSRLEGDFDETWNTQKQKRRVDYKFKKVKDKKGKVHFIPVKDKSTGVQPSNVVYEKGDIKKQERYNPREPGKGNSSGSWYHNRGPTPDDLIPGSEEVIDKNKYNADMRERVREWWQHVEDRPDQPMTMTKPF